MRACRAAAGRRRSLIEVLIDDTGLGEIRSSCRRWSPVSSAVRAPSLARVDRAAPRTLRTRAGAAGHRSSSICWWCVRHRDRSVVGRRTGAEFRRLCGRVAWFKGTDDRWLRRLKLAAETGGALGVLFRPERHRFESSPAALRVVDDAGERGTRLELLKVQGGRPCSVDLEPA